MLILSRKAGESVVIDGRIVVRVLAVSRGRMRVGIEARTEIPVRRSACVPKSQAGVASQPARAKRP
jgi:carbon storage regulator